MFKTFETLVIGGTILVGYLWLLVSFVRLINWAFPEMTWALNATYPGMLGKLITVRLYSGEVVNCRILYFGQSGRSYLVRTQTGQEIFATDANVPDRKAPYHTWVYDQVEDVEYRPFDEWRKPRLMSNN